MVWLFDLLALLSTEGLDIQSSARLQRLVDHVRLNRPGREPDLGQAVPFENGPARFWKCMLLQLQKLASEMSKFCPFRNVAPENDKKCWACSHAGSFASERFPFFQMRASTSQSNKVSIPEDLPKPDPDGKG